MSRLNIIYMKQRSALLGLGNCCHDTILWERGTGLERVGKQFVKHALAYLLAAFQVHVWVNRTDRMDRVKRPTELGVYTAANMNMYEQGWKACKW